MTGTVDLLIEAAVVDQLGAPPRHGHHQLAEPAPGQALIEVAAAALNPIDLLISAGRHPAGRPPVPHVPGVEGVGRVVRAGSLAAGSRVRFLVQGGFVPGALAGYVVVDERACVPVPDGLDEVAAAALGVVGTGALIALRDAARLRAGERVLVLAGTGAFGRMFIQLAKILGAGRVVAAGRDQQRLAELDRIGADAVLTLPPLADLSPGWLAEATQDRFDVIVDPLWGGYPAAALRCLAGGGRLVNVAQLAGPSATLQAAGLRHGAASVIGFSGAALPAPAIAAAYQEVAGHLLAGRLSVQTSVHPLGEVAAAWREQAGGAGGRKIVLTP
jgi:NADPH:quinone reductase-like Zn-dependent oxidoreductase